MGKKILTLFEECIIALGHHARIFERQESQSILESFDNNFPLTSWGRIDWKRVKEKRDIASREEIVPILKMEKKDPSALVYVIGSDPTIPIIESRLENLLECFDDVEAVCPNSWFYCPSNGCVIEIYHDGDITIGWVSEK